MAKNIERCAVAATGKKTADGVQKPYIAYSTHPLSFSEAKKKIMSKQDRTMLAFGKRAL